MALSLKEIQARLLEEQSKKDRVRTGQFQGDNAIYPFWNNPEGSTATIRYLPDGDVNNDYFWVERLIIKLPFRGVKGQPDSKPCDVQVPSVDMWKPGSCPINAEIRPWWKDDSLVDMARKYYRKKSYLFQGFVPNNPHKEDSTPENPIRRLVINPSIFDMIKGILLRPDLEYSPTDYEHGRDFYLTKTTKGNFANYTSSSWAMKERPLGDVERLAIEQHGLYNLSSFLPKRPDEDGLRVIMEMFQASVEEQPYDPERWGNYFKPTGMRVTDNDHDNASTTKPVQVRNVPMPPPQVANTPQQEAATPPWEEAVETAPRSAGKPTSPDEILAAIRARQQKK